MLVLRGFGLVWWIRWYVPRGMKCFFFEEGMVPVLGSLVDMVGRLFFLQVKQKRLRCCTCKRKWKYTRGRLSGYTWK